MKNARRRACNILYFCQVLHEENNKKKVVERHGTRTIRVLS